jgi:hypothetical protein
MATFYRFAQDMNIENAASEEKGEVKRFSHEYVNEMWQTDCM